MRNLWKGVGRRYDQRQGRTQDEEGGQKACVLEEAHCCGLCIPKLNAYALAATRPRSQKENDGRPPMRNVRARLLRRLAYQAWVELGQPGEPGPVRIYRWFKRDYKRRSLGSRRLQVEKR